MTEQTPTDAELLALNAGEVHFSESPTKYPEAGHGTQYHAGAPGVLSFARAVLAKWGSPVVAGEPVAWMARLPSGSEVFARTRDFYPDAVPVYTTPPPTHAQAGAVPLTEAQKREMATDWFAEDWAVSKAIGLIDDYETLQGITKEGGPAMKYSCTVLFDASASVDVEADSAEAAANKAEEKVSGHQNLCHQCSGTLDTSDSYGVLVYDEAGEIVADTRFSEELRRRDTALIRQLVEALEGHQGNYKLTAHEAEPVNDAITAARARLNQGAPQNGN